MEFANQILLVGVLLYLVGFVTALVLPSRWTNPVKVTISCKECDWSKTFKDRGKDETSIKLMDKMTAMHKAHFAQAHPDQKWEVKM